MNRLRRFLAAAAVLATVAVAAPEQGAATGSCPGAQTAGTITRSGGTYVDGGSGVGWGWNFSTPQTIVAEVYPHHLRSLYFLHNNGTSVTYTWGAGVTTNTTKFVTAPRNPIQFARACWE